METKSKISFGFKKAVPGIGNNTPIASASSSKKASLFDSQEDDESFRPSTSVFESKKKNPITSISGAAPLSRSVKARTEDALNVDASIFDYDGVYDSMKVGERQAAHQREEEKKRRDPKYISAFLASSEQRKLDRSRAEAKMIQREREAEGEEYAGTEAFVTDAYKEQMEEIKLAEEKEKKKEEENRSKSKGVAGFYKNFMEERDKEHQAAVAASLQSKSSLAAVDYKEPVIESILEKEEEKQRAVEEARRKGKDVRVNDDNEVVDERSLLSAGLNTFGSKKKYNAHEGLNGIERHASNARIAPRDGAREAREAQRQRQSKMIEEQMLELERKKDEEVRQEEEQKRKALVQERRNDSDSVAKARERALERKRKREEEEAEKKRVLDN